MASLETKVREAQSYVMQGAEATIKTLQTSDWKIIQDKLHQLASNRTETSAVLLALDYLATRSGGTVDSGFGKLLVAITGYNLVSFSLQDKPLQVLKASAGLVLEGRDAETVGNFTVGALGASGVLALATAWDGPSNHPLSVLMIGVLKFIFSFVLLNRDADPKAKEPLTNLLELGRYHARTGILLFVYSLLLFWRAKTRLSAPKYIVDLEKRINERLDQMVAVVKDQKSRIDALNPTPTTPKKY